MTKRDAPHSSQRLTGLGEGLFMSFSSPLLFTRVSLWCEGEAGTRRLLAWPPLTLLCGLEGQYLDEFWL